MASWQQAAANYSALEGVAVRRFGFEGFEVMVQYNPARAASTGAKTDAGSIAARPCFLCRRNRPECQYSIVMGDFELLVNPFPIFMPHYTIAHREHTPQRLMPYAAALLGFARELEGMAVFYNGARCGASAPDHAHFQACPMGCLPVCGDYFRMRDRGGRTPVLWRGRGVVVRRMEGYLRSVVCIEADDAEGALGALREWVAAAEMGQEEAMVNVVAAYVDGRYCVWVFPRRRFRPWQYDAEEGGVSLFRLQRWRWRGC